MKKIHVFRLLALLLCLSLLCTLFACTGEEDAEKAPDGMQNATAEGADYRLYIPTHWSLNLDYGISGGYYSLGTQSNISVEAYPITEETEMALSEAEAESAAERATWYYENTIAPLVASVATGGVERGEEDSKSLLLDGVNAIGFHAKATVADALIHFVHVVGERKNTFYVISYSVEEALYENLKEDYRSICAEFVFSDTLYESPDNRKEIAEEDGIPEGMQLASNGDVSYRFFVPLSWRVDLHQTIFASVAPDGSSSVSVVPYLPHSDEVMNIEEYFEKTRDALKKAAPEGYEEISQKEVKLGGAAAMQYEYRYRVGGVTYSYLQVITVWRGMFYSLTYTALPERYESNLPDVQKIIDAFELR